MPGARTLLSCLVVGALSLAGPLHAQDGCALLKPADLSALLGGPVTAKPVGAACSWSAGPRKLLSVVYKATGPAATMAFQGARGAASEGGQTTVTDEAGIGDKAFASLESFGVVIVMLKQGRLLQLQYHTGAAGTTKDLEALRPVAKKAIAAY